MLEIMATGMQRTLQRVPFLPDKGAQKSGLRIDENIYKNEGWHVYIGSLFNTYILLTDILGRAIISIFKADK